MRSARGSLVAVVVGLALVVGACSDSNDRSSSDAGGAGGDASAEGTGRGGGAGASVEELSGAVENREVVYTANLQVQVDDAAEAASRAVVIARGAGGFLSRESADLEGDGGSQLTLRVPGPAFDEVLQELGDLGEVRDRWVEAVDVTDEVVDVEGRLATLRASADRLRALLAEAGSTADIVAVEAELAQREADIESLEGRLRVLEDQVGFATIEVTLSVERDPSGDGDPPGFFEALRSGWSALVSLLLIGVAVLGFLLPFLPFLVAAWLASRWLSRRRRPGPRHDHRPPPPTGFGAPPAGGPPSEGGPGGGSSETDRGAEAGGR